MKGRPPKDPERRQRRPKRARLRVWTTKVPDPPDAPTGWLRVTLAAWKRYWSSPASNAIDRDTDLEAVIRLFSLRDERERSARAYRKERFLPGSKGQPTLNPLARLIPQLDAEIRHLEDRLGMNPVARHRLGPATPRPSVDELNADLTPDDDALDPRTEAADG